MAEINNVNQAQDFIKAVAATGGDKDKIDTLKEKDILAKALANICDEKAYAEVKNAIADYKPYQPPKSKGTQKSKKSEKPVQPNIVNNSRDHVGGTGNLSVGGNNNTVTIYNGVVPNQKDDVSTDNENPVEKNKPEEGNKSVEPKPLSPKEAREARANGAEAADALIGYTSKADQAYIRNIIRTEVNERTVLEFLKGYTDNSSGGNYFFEQMESEYGFDQAQNLMHDVGAHLQKYLENKYGIDNEQAKEIATILAESVINRDKAEELDEIVNKEFVN